MDLRPLFSPKTVAIIGASREPQKLGHVIAKNFIYGAYDGEVFLVNPKADEILGKECYKSVLDIKEDVDLAVIAVPAPAVPSIVEECGKKGVKGVILISGGFCEVGNCAGEERVAEAARKHSMALIGPNCVGIYDPATGVDTLFLPPYKLARPRRGGVSFITQSGAIGGAVLDWAAKEGLGINKFISYGNAAVVDETDLLDYLSKDKSTRVIAVYVEGVKRGREFMKIAKRTSCAKPVIIIKAGKTSLSAHAAKSHTGTLAGDYAVYKGVFKQCGLIEAETMEELFNFAKLLDYQPLPKGGKVAIITNAGGTGVLTVDELEKNSLSLAKFSSATLEKIKASVPAHAVVSNPVDLTGDVDANRYAVALQNTMNDQHADALIVIVLLQTPALESQVVDVIVRESDRRKKPILVITTGGEYTEMHRRMLESSGVPTYSEPSLAVKALARMVHYSQFASNKCILLQ